jgi:hypothetical protein
MMAKPAPKRRENVRRYGNGRIINADRGESEKQILATVLAQPHRAGERSHLAGFAYGRMFLGGMLDQRQFEAAEVYTKRTVRHMSVITSSLPRFPSIAANMVGTFSTGSGGDPDDETIGAIKSAYGELQDALADSGMLYDGNRILTAVCVMDKDIADTGDMGAFRCALNVIANRLRIA